METYLVYPLFLGISAGRLWLRTYSLRALTVKRLIVHAVIFALLSLSVLLLVLRMIFSRAGNICSASNLSMLGMLFLLSAACLAAFALTCGK